MNKLVYVVSEYGGTCDDWWEEPVGVCSSLESALELKNKILTSKGIKTNISKEEYEDMLDYLYNYENEHNDFEYETEIEGIIKLFPDKDPKDIEIIDKEYFSPSDFKGVDITEVKFYN